MANTDKYEDLGYIKSRGSKPARSAVGSSKSDLIRITGLWATQSGNAWSGLVSPSCKLVILENKQRKKPSDPEYIAFWAPASESKEDRS